MLPSTVIMVTIQARYIILSWHTYKPCQTQPVIYLELEKNKPKYFGCLIFIFNIINIYFNSLLSQPDEISYWWHGTNKYFKFLWIWPRNSYPTRFSDNCRNENPLSVLWETQILIMYQVLRRLPGPIPLLWWHIHNKYSVSYIIK